MSSRHLLNRPLPPPLLKFSLLPFLYNTRTLRRFYSEIGSGSQHGNLELLEQASREDQGQKSSRAHAGHESGRTTKGKGRSSAGSTKRHSESKSPSYDRTPFASSRDHASFGAQSGVRRWTPRTTMEEDIPFDSPDVEATERPVAKVEATTLSDAERKAFEKLRKLGASKQQQPQQQGQGLDAAKGSVLGEDRSETLEDILEEAMSKIEEERDAPARAYAIQQVQESEFARISDLFRDAATDLELWNILQKQVFDPIAALDLDSPKDERGDRRTTASESAHSAEAIRPDSREVVMRNFPLHLWNAARMLRSGFPTSPMLLAIIPAIRHLGPSVYALGASTKLYNQMISYTFHNLTDMEGIGELLQEMEDEAIEPDRITLDTLNDIMLMWQRLRRGFYGEVARVAWETERSRRALTNISRWRTRVQEFAQEQEVARLARKQRRSGKAERMMEEQS